MPNNNDSSVAEWSDIPRTGGIFETYEMEKFIFSREGI